MKIPFLKRDIPKRAALVVVALAAVAGVVTGREKPPIELIEARTARPQMSTVVDIDLDKLHRGEAAASQNDPFARRSFAPAPVQQAAAAAAAPSAPVLPFRYFGKLTEKGKTEVFVMRGDELISIAAGRKIDHEYRVERITDSSISFTYLPLKMTQSIDLPAVN
jgi:hypothetical protein